MRSTRTSPVADTLSRVGAHLHPTRIDIPAEARSRLIPLLNGRLADAIDLHLQAKQAHWNVKGPGFIALHELFDRIAGEIDGHVDELAERVTALGGTAEGTLQAVAGAVAIGVACSGTAVVANVIIALPRGAAAIFEDRPAIGQIRAAMKA